MTETISPMLEKAAKALARRNIPGSIRSGEARRRWEDDQWPHYWPDARAVIETLMEPDEAMVREVMAAALTTMAYAGLPPDSQEMLVNGDGRGIIPPGILRKGVEAYRTAMLQSILHTHKGEG